MGAMIIELHINNYVHKLSDMQFYKQTWQYL